MLIIEGLVMCFILLLICVVGIANGPVGLVIFYEQEVKDRVIGIGLSDPCCNSCRHNAINPINQNGRMIVLI